MKKIISIILFIALATLQIGCTASPSFSSTTETSQIDTNSQDSSAYTYIAKNHPAILPCITNSMLCDDIFYYQDSFYDDKTDDFYWQIKGYNLKTNSYSTNIALYAADILSAADYDSPIYYARLTNFRFTCTGSFIYLVCEIELSDDIQFYYVTMSTNGDYVDAVYLGSWELNPYYSNTSNEHIKYCNMHDAIFLKNGNFLVLFEKSLCYFSSYPELLGSIDLPSDCIIVKLTEIDGIPYLVCFEDYFSKPALLPIEKNGRSVFFGQKTSYDLGASSNIALTPISTKEYLYPTNHGACVFDSLTSSITELFSWDSINIDPIQVQSVYLYPNSKIDDEDAAYIVLLNDWNSNTSTLKIVSRVQRSSLSEKCELILESLYQDSELASAISAYNNSQDYCHITYSYSGYDSIDSSTRDELDLKLVSGNGPDMVEFDFLMDKNDYFEKDVFIDLMPYLNSSSELSYDDYYKNTVAEFTCNDKLFALPKYINIYMLVGNKDILGSEGPWAIKDIIEIDNSNPDIPFLIFWDRDNVIYDLTKLSSNSFINYDNNTCNFDSPEFIALLEYSSKYPAFDELDTASLDYSPLPAVNGSALAGYYYISSYTDLQRIAPLFPDGYVIKGYPTSDASMGYELSTNSNIGITASCEHPELAFEFIEFFSNYSSNYSLNQYSLKARKSLNAAIASSELSFNESYSFSISYDGINYTEIYHSSQSEIDIINDIINKATPNKYFGAEITGIISEEASAYYAGQKTAEDVAKIIQSRVSLYLAENF